MTHDNFALDNVQVTLSEGKPPPPPVQQLNRFSALSSSRLSPIWFQGRKEAIEGGKGIREVGKNGWKEWGGEGKGCVSDPLILSFFLEDARRHSKSTDSSYQQLPQTSGECVQRKPVIANCMLFRHGAHKLGRRHCWQFVAVRSDNKKIPNFTSDIILLPSHFMCLLQQSKRPRMFWRETLLL